MARCRTIIMFQRAKKHTHETIIELLFNPLSHRCANYHNKSSAAA